MDHDVRQGIDELLYFQSGLLREKITLKKLLTKIDEQIHALQVEQLHLLNSMNVSMKMKDSATCTKHATDNTSDTLFEKNLDLTVRNLGNYSEEEEDDDEDDDDDDDDNDDIKRKTDGYMNEEEIDLDFLNF